MSLTFASAYRSLRPGEKAYVDGYVADIEAQSIKRNERISLALNRPIDAETVAQSRGMLDKPMVRAAITERINQLAADQELNPRALIKELMGIARFNIGDYGEVGEDGQFYVDLSKCTPEQLARLKKCKIEESMRGNRKTEIEGYDKMTAIQMLLRFMGLQEDNAIWREQSARPVQAVLPAGATVDAAANAYAALING